MAEISLETEAILNRLKNEGDLIRNSGKNSIKQVNINLDKLHTTFKAINAAMLNNTAVIKQASDIENKIRKEEAERARRQGEIDELTQKDKAKAAELRAKADALRAKQELKDAKGPGLFAKFKESDTKKLLKNAAIIGSIGFVAGNIALGVLDKKFEDEGGFVKAMETRGNQFLDDAGKRLQINLEDGITKGIREGINQGINSALMDPDIKEITDVIKNIQESTWTKVIAAVVATIGAASLISALVGLGRFTLDIYDRAKKYIPKNRVGPPAPPKKDPPKQPKINMNNARQDELFDKDGKPNPNVARKPTLLEQTKKLTVTAGKNVVKGTPLVGPAVIATDIAMNGVDAKKLTDREVLGLLATGEFDQSARTGLGDIALETGISAGVGAGVGSVIPGVGTVAGGVSGTVWGFLSGVARATVELYQDSFTDLGIDDIPNRVEKALKREIALMDSEDLTPENMANKLNATAKEIAETRATLERQLAEPLAELANLRTRLENVGDGTDKKTKKKREDLEKQIEKIEKDIANPYSQLQNTIKIQEMANERRNRFLESIGQKPIAMLDNTGASETLASLASAGGGSFVNTQVINNTYNNQFVQNSRNNWNSGQVIVDNMTGGSGEQVALG
jgi:hypothetical protein